VELVRVIESDQPGAVRRVQRERVTEAMRPLRRRLHALDFEFEPVSPFQMMNAPVERQQELETIVRRPPIHIIR